ncbi:hypothetical protein ARMSODRAFT_972772 [Armillaria solidipes]|uniref:Ribonuclease H1 N-terminal domain-containing protein n=1 Tax=Armillaria solidipes TaxID=1076256 RepID=A0A2H3C7H9_9AGAR|nr:hypothetical protein ARMSODRAFT_972772 [Armillaria solidipes]
MTTSHEIPSACGGAPPPPPAPGVADVDVLANILARVSLTPTQATALIGAILATVSTDAPASPAPAPAAPASAAVVSVGANYEYHTPLPGEAGPFYVVSRGREVGVFAGWEDTSPLITGVSGAVYCSASSYIDAITRIENALHRGNCAILPASRTEACSGAGPSTKTNNC